MRPLMQAASGRVLAREGSAWIKGGCRTGSHLPRLRYHCLTTGRRVSDTRATATPRARAGHGVGPAPEAGRREADGLPDGDASLDLSRRTEFRLQDTVQDDRLGLTETTESWGGAEGARVPAGP